MQYSEATVRNHQRQWDLGFRMDKKNVKARYLRVTDTIVKQVLYCHVENVWYGSILSNHANPEGRTENAPLTLFVKKINFPKVFLIFHIHYLNVACAELSDIENKLDSISLRNEEDGIRTGHEDGIRTGHESGMRIIDPFTQLEPESDYNIDQDVYGKEFDGFSFENTTNRAFTFVQNELTLDTVSDEDPMKNDEIVGFWVCGLVAKNYKLRFEFLTNNSICVKIRSPAVSIRGYLVDYIKFQLPEKSPYDHSLKLTDLPRQILEVIKNNCKFDVHHDVVHHYSNAVCVFISYFSSPTIF